MKALSFLVAASALFAGCGPEHQPGSKHWFYSSPHGYGVEQLSKRATFDLQCPVEQLTYQPLGSWRDGYEIVGVTGCEQRATYVRLEGKWLMQSDAK